MQRVASGPDKQGYPVEFNKVWFTKLAPIIKISKALLQVGCGIAGIKVDLGLDQLFNDTIQSEIEQNAGWNEQVEELRSAIVRPQSERLRDANAEHVTELHTNLVAPGYVALYELLLTLENQSSPPPQGWKPRCV